MKYAGKNPQGQRIEGKFVKQFRNGITIEYPNGVVEFIITERVIGPVSEQKESNDLFAPF